MMTPRNYIVLTDKDIKILVEDSVRAVEQILSQSQYPHIKDFDEWVKVTKQNFQDSAVEDSTELLERASDGYAKALVSLDERFGRLSEKREKEVELKEILDEGIFFARANIDPKQIVKDLQQTLATELKLIDFNDELKKIKHPFSTFETGLEELAGPFRYTRRFGDAVKILENEVQELSDKLTSDLSEKIKMLFAAVEKRFANMIPFIEKELPESFPYVKALEAVKEYLDNFDDTEIEIEQIESLLHELNRWNKEIKKHLHLFKQDNACLLELKNTDSQISSDDKETLKHLFGKSGKKLQTRLRLSKTPLKQADTVEKKIIGLYQKYQLQVRKGPPRLRNIFQHACERLQGIRETLEEESDD